MGISDHAPSTSGGGLPCHGPAPCDQNAAAPIIAASVASRPPPPTSTFSWVRQVCKLIMGSGEAIPRSRPRSFIAHQQGPRRGLVGFFASIGEESRRVSRVLVDALHVIALTTPYQIAGRNAINHAIALSSGSFPTGLRSSRAASRLPKTPRPSPEHRWRSHSESAQCRTSDRRVASSNGLSHRDILRAYPPSRCRRTIHVREWDEVSSGYHLPTWCQSSSHRWRIIAITCAALFERGRHRDAHCSPHRRCGARHRFSC